MTTSSGSLNPHADRSPMLYIPIAVFAAICPILVTVRIWSRLRKGGKLGADDYTIVASLVFSLASDGIMIAACKYGFGRHFATLTPYQQVHALMYFYLCQITYKASINLTKCSILLLYLRIFSKVRWFKWVCWFLVGCITIYCIASVTATIFQCTPVRAAFDHSIVDSKCIDNATFWYANAGFSIGTDLLILFIPMPLVYKLQIPWIQKMALMVVFALGGFVVITSCLRITTIDITATTNDVTYDLASTMWTIVEPNVAITCACLPVIRPLIIKIFPKLMPKSTSAGQTYGQSSTYGSKNFMPGASQSRADKSEWIQIGGKENGIHMATIKRAGSNTGSEESILASAGPQHSSHPSDGGLGGGHNNNPMAIQKTVQYSIEYSAK